MLESNAAAGLELDEILTLVKEVAVSPVPIGKRRIEVMGAKQQHMEWFATFVS